MRRCVRVRVQCFGEQKPTSSETDVTFPAGEGALWHLRHATYPGQPFPRRCRGCSLRGGGCAPCPAGEKGSSGRVGDRRGSPACSRIGSRKFPRHFSPHTPLFALATTSLDGRAGESSDALRGSGFGFVGCCFFPSLRNNH